MLSRFGKNAITPLQRASMQTRYLSTEAPLVRKVLIANRGEIACRVVATCKRFGIRTVAVFSDEDKRAKHVRVADEAYRIGPAPSLESYLCGDIVSDVAVRVGADAIHPGYGFLSENEDFAALCASKNIRFIGPPPSAIRAMGSKSESKILMEQAGVPVVPGYHGPNQDDGFLMNAANSIGYPLIIKPVMGGGGKGMRIVTKPEEFLPALESSRSEALHSFKDDRVLLERYLTKPRHIEVQVFCDTHGNAVYLFERDCSVQRRHQKIFEEAPGPSISEELRHSIGAQAVAAAKAVGYVGAGTVEFIMDADTGEFFFMEMNTRLQVEHPVTEAVTGVDLVEWQLRVVSGQPLPLKQHELKLDGHAIEARIYAEDTARQFMPTAGRIKHLVLPHTDAKFTGLGERGVRVDSGVEEGDCVSTHYDPMIAKLIVKGANRAQALDLLQRSLQAYQVVGVESNIEFLIRASAHPAFIAGPVDTGFIGKYQKEILPANANQAINANNTAVLAAAVAIKLPKMGPNTPGGVVADAGNFRVNHTAKSEVEFELAKGETTQTISIPLTYVSKNHITSGPNNILVHGLCEDPHFSAGRRLYLELDVNGSRTRATVIVDRASSKVHVFTQTRDEQSGNIHTQLTIPAPKFEEILAGGSHMAGQGLVAPMPGEVQKVLVKAGDKVKRGDRLVVLVAMKMEHVINAPKDGVIKDVYVSPKDSVPAGAELLAME